MKLETRNIAELTQADIEELLSNRVQEGKSIDYKRELPGTNDSARKEFLFDVSSFANASGGHLVYGIEEQGGIPTQICGLTVSDPDAELLRLQSCIQDGIDPRIPGLEVRFVPLADSRHVFVIRIPRSWNPPHMVTLQGVNRFYARNGAGKYLLDASELRSLFVLSSSAMEQVRRFRAERIGRIVADETPIMLSPGAKTILHLIPLQAFSAVSQIDIPRAWSSANLSPLGSDSRSKRFNLDGLLLASGTLQGQSSPYAYLQLYRNGIIETVNAAILGANARLDRNAQFLIPSTSLEIKIIHTISECLSFLRDMGVSPPVVVMLTLTGVKGFNMAVGPKLIDCHAGAPIDRDIVIVPEVLLETLEFSSRSVRPLLDSVWNAAGWPQSPNFDADGNHKPQ